MDAQNTAKKIFAEELKNFLESYKTGAKPCADFDASSGAPGTASSATGKLDDMANGAESEAKFDAKSGTDSTTSPGAVYDTLNIANLKSQVHRLKGGAGMLQLLDVREALVNLEVALKQNQNIDEFILQLQQSYEKIS